MVGPAKAGHVAGSRLPHDEPSFESHPLLGRSTCPTRKEGIICGIVASFRPGEAADAAPALRLVSRLAHRGPDDEAAGVRGGAALAHRRLSIIDLAGGRQPLDNASSEGGALVLACNGEIYNHARLRAGLERSGHRFATRSDSEVILHLYEEHGPALVERLDGMYAFALSDGERLLAARDPLGIKPLYRGHDAGGRLWLGSELRALADVCDDVEEFPAGARETAPGGVERWFRPAWASGERPGGPADPAGIAKWLHAAVEKRLMSDVPVGVFLSGGLDSSLIAALVREHVGELHSFAVGLEGSPDLVAAREVARHLGTIHHERVCTPEEAAAAADRVVVHLESYDPALVRSAVPCYLVSELAAGHVKVVLTGEGADEAFAGYRYLARYRDPAALQRECVRLLLGLHNMNLQRVDRMTMAHGLEARVPFLDTGFLERVMAIDPVHKLRGPGRPEKWLLRTAFEGRLPEAILWRGKQEFAAGCGFEQVLARRVGGTVDRAVLAGAARTFPDDPPASAEAWHYRSVFAREFPGAAARRTVARWRGGDSEAAGAAQ